MDSKQNFLEAALAVGLECQLIKPGDVLKHLPPDVLASNLPAESKTKLLAASLQAGKMDADLVFDTLEVRVFAENMPKHLLWACIAEAAKRVLKEDFPASTAPTAKPSPPKVSSSKPTSSLTDRPRRRPNLSRRPARLTQTRQKRSTGENDVDAESAGRWAGSTPPRDTEPTANEQPFNEWVEETVTGDGISRRNKG